MPPATTLRMLVVLVWVLGGSAIFYLMLVLSFMLLYIAHELDSGVVTDCNSSGYCSLCVPAHRHIVALRYHYHDRDYGHGLRLWITNTHRIKRTWTRSDTKRANISSSARSLPMWRTSAQARPSMPCHFLPFATHMSLSWFWFWFTNSLS